ncbi:MAG: LLM class flavin-dependent oxidoreductase [Actinomycetota bacterium]
MALFIDYGLVTGQRAPDDLAPWTDVYDDIIAVASAVEAGGFDGLWVSEHHFTDDGYMSGLFAVLGALAVSTSRLTLGTNVALAPLYQPLRLAEDAAVVDVLSHGRLLLGLAIGYRDEEFAALGVPKRERVARLEECVEVCRKAWTGERFSHRGVTTDVYELVVRPAPTLPPPIWLGGWVDAAIERAGVLGDGYISPLGDLDDTRRRVEVLDRASQTAGRSGALPIGTATWCALTPQGASSSISRGVAHLYARYSTWYSSSSDVGGGQDVGNMIAQILGMPSDQLPPTIVSGTADQMIEALAPLAAEFSGSRDHRLCVRLQYPGMSRAEVLEQVEQFTKEVMPALRGATSQP